MSRENWKRIKQSKFFYVKFYRRITTWVILSILLNIVLCFGLIYSYLNRPARTYYATSGITAPVELKALDMPNNSSEALLPSDPIDVPENKFIPD